jgi:hypothetical protein
MSDDEYEDTMNEFPDGTYTANISEVDEVLDNSITFDIDTENVPVMEFKANGDILIKGRLAANDKEIVYALRDFLKAGGYLD